MSTTAMTEPMTEGSSSSKSSTDEAPLLYSTRSSAECTPLSPYDRPERIHKLVIQVDHLGWADLETLEKLLKGLKTTLKATFAIKKVTTRAAIDFCLPQLFRVLRQFHVYHLVLYSSDILASSSFQSDYLNQIRELHHLELVACGPSLAPLSSSSNVAAVKWLTLHVSQDDHLQSLNTLDTSSIRTLELSIRASRETISNAAVTNLRIPQSVETLQVKCVDFDLYHALSDAISASPNISKLVLRWDTACPERLVWGLRPCPNIINLRVTIKRFRGPESRQFVQGMNVLLPQWTHLKSLSLEATQSLKSASTTKEEFLLLLSILQNIPFIQLTSLSLLLGTTTLDDDFGKRLVTLVQQQSTLRDLNLPLKHNKMSTRYDCDIAHYLGMHAFPKDVLYSLEEDSVSLWSFVLARAATTPSVLFHLLLEKNDALIPKRYNG